jgi:hypothetical protein
MRTVGNVTGDLLQITVNVAAAWQATIAVGDLCALDTTANFTITDTADNALPLGKVLSLSGDSSTAVIEVYGFRAVRAFTTDAAVAVGVDINIKGAGTNIIDATAVPGSNYTMVISDPGGAGTAYVLV